jgi:general secretion pathway protein D
MKTPRMFMLLALLFIGIAPVFAQGSSSAERKAFREYTSPEELISIAPTTPMDRAFTVLSELSKKFAGKIIIDTERRSMPINIDIHGMHWRDALETICRKNDIWYSEYENYIQISGGRAGESAEGARGGVGPNVEMQKEVATFKSREVKISAVFLEVDLNRLEETGVNWNFMKSNSDATVTSTFSGGDRVADKIFHTEFTPKINFANINLVANVFSNYSLGQVLSGPQLIVRSGEEGRIQVGQDFSIKERDFAGNIIDKFYSAGTIIKVRPQVITEQGVSFVHMVVDVERSNVVPGSVSTIINKSKANTNLLLLDGEETIIGGLYDNEVTSVRTGIPFLKDLPWYVLGLRYVFGYDRDEVNKKELIILMKADIVPTLQERITQRTKEDRVFDRWLEEKQREEQHIKGKIE